MRVYFLGLEVVRFINVFYYLIYEGSVNLESMIDLVMKEVGVYRSYVLINEYRVRK